MLKRNLLFIMVALILTSCVNVDSNTGEIKGSITGEATRTGTPTTQEPEPSNQDEVVVKGSIGGGTSSFEKGATSEPVADTVWAVPTAGIVDLYDIVIADILSDGSFKMSLPRRVTYAGYEFDVLWVLVLVNSKAVDRKERAVAFVTLSDGTSSLSSLPLANTKNDLDLGLLSINGDEARSSLSLSEGADKFSINLAQLKEMTRIEDLFKGIKNIVINNDDIIGKIFDVHPTISFILPWEDGGGSSQIENIVYSGYTVNMYYKKVMNADFVIGVCDKTTTVEIYPPLDVTLIGGDGKSYTRGPLNPFTSDEETVLKEQEDYIYCETIHNGMSEMHFSAHLGKEQNSIDFSLDNIQGGMPEGYWNVMRDGELAAEFNLVSNNIFSNNGIPIIYMPSVKISADENDIVTKIAVTWYQFDFDSDGYEEISDLSAFNNLIRAINIAFVDEHYNGTMVGEGKLLLKEPVTEVTSFEKKWKMHETEEEIKTTPTFETLRIEYYIGGTAVNFVLENK